jgi:hypothetical protein
MIQELEINNKEINIDFKSLTSLRKLEIHNPKNKIPADISALNQLEALSLSGIAQVPEEIFKLTSLTTLILEGKLSDNTFSKPYPDLFDKLSNLENLSLGMANGTFPVSVFSLNKLKNLTIILENCETFPKLSLSSLPQLQSLTLQANHFSEWMFEEIAALPNLETLTLDVVSVIKHPFKSDLSALGKSASLKSIKILNAQLPSFPQSFSNLVTLKDFYLEATELRRFETTLDGYFENLPDTLESLYIDYLIFNYLPENISRFQQLKSLYLTSKAITDGYENLLLLPQCPKIYFRFYQRKDDVQLIEYITLEPDVKSKYSELLQYFRENPMPLEEQKKIMLLSYKSKNVSLDKKDLLRLLDFPKSIIREQVFARLIQIIENPFVKPDFNTDKAIIGIAGKIKQRKTSDLKQALLKQGYRFAEFPSSNITHLVIAQDGIKDTNPLLNNKYTLALPEHLIELIEKEEKPYLKNSDAMLEENVMQLLHAPDENSKQLALQMMLEGGIPESKFTEFVICVLMREYGQASTKAVLKKVIEKHCIAAWINFFKTFSRLNLIDDYDDKVITHPLIDKADFIKTGLELTFKKAKKWFIFFIIRVHKFDSQLLKTVFDYLIQDKILDLRQNNNWQYNERENLSKVLSWKSWEGINFDNIETVEISAFDFGLMDSHVLKNLQMLPNLKQIHVFNATNPSKNTPKPDNTLAELKKISPHVEVRFI